MQKHVNLFFHAILVGLIAALVIIVCDLFSLRAWVVFFAWANYFLHGCKFKKSMKMLLALCLGILLAFIASEVITHFNTLFAPTTQMFISAGVIFVVATALIYLECINHWEEMVPASFLGTVLFFASGVELSNILPDLVLPLVVGIIAGFITILSRQKLSQLLPNLKKLD